jgi:hypothetical protein
VRDFAPATGEGSWAAAGAIKQYFLLDVLSFGKLDSFLKTIQTEVDAGIEMLRDR